MLAGAGSGKTRALAYRVAWIIAQGKTAPKNTLLLTFTNKAAGEMKERIRKLTKQTPGFAGTFHSFCVRVLRIDGKDIGIPSNFLIYDDQDSKDLVRQIIKNLNLSLDSHSPSSIASQISGAKSKMLSPTQYAEIATGDWQEKIFKIYTEYEKLLKESEALDFDDLLLKTVKLYKKEPKVLKKWQDRLTHVFVDEWQDTNKIQYMLTKQIVGDKENLTAVGDASQSIYSWRGADYRNINYLIKDFPNIKIINLERNYRSTQSILSAANSVIEKNKNHPILKLWTKKGKGDKIRLYRARSELDEAGFLINEINSLKKQGLKLKDFAILYRTNAQSRVLEEALLHAGTPYVLVRGVRFYDRREIKDVLAYLRLLVNPKDKISIERIKKLGKRRLEKFRGFAESARSNFTESITLDLMDSVLEKTSYLDKYKAETEENLARLENIKELRSVATEFPNINEFLENVALVEAEQDSKGKVSPLTTNNLPQGDSRSHFSTVLRPLVGYQMRS